MATPPNQQNFDWPVPRGRSSVVGHLNPTKFWLIGQDKFFAGPGKAPNYDWPNPISARARLPSVLLKTFTNNTTFLIGMDAAAPPTTVPVSTSEQWVQRTADDYTRGFNNLLPTGPAWPRESGSALQSVIAGLSEIWGDPVEALAALLLTLESDPRLTTNLLPDWERAFGLPDKCLSEPLTIGDRRIALAQRIILLGAQDRRFFIKIAAAIGYTISISEYRPFMVGIDAVGDNRTIGDGESIFRDQFGHDILDPVGNEPIANLQYSEFPCMIGPPEIRFYWTVHVGLARLTWFRVSAGQCGIDPHLRIGLATDLECLLRRYKPAHTDIIFDYSGLAVGGSMAGTP